MRGRSRSEKMSRFSQIRLANPIAAAAVQAALSQQAHYTHGTALSVVLCSPSTDSNAFENGRVRKSDLTPTFSRQWPSSMQSSLRTRERRVALRQFVVVAFEATSCEVASHPRRPFTNATCTR